MENSRQHDQGADGENTKDSGNVPPAALGSAEFARESAATLARIEQALTDADIDVEADFVSEGVLEIEFSDGSKMIVNRHEVSREIWVAGRTGAFHFRWGDGGWVDTRSSEPLMTVVSRLASQMSGQAVTLS